MATEYFLDADNGNDGSVGTAIGTAWKTFSKFTATAVADDLGTIRGGMTATYQLASPADLEFTADGTIAAPIRMEYDYDDQFSDHVDLAAAGPTETATLTVGSKVWTYSGDVSAGVAAGDVLYASGDDNREFAYEVDTVSTVTVTMYLPYKGAQAGSGKTTFNMQSMPIWGTVAGVFQLNLDNDHYWMFQGIHFRGTDTNGVIEIDSTHDHVFADCVIEGNGSSDFGIKVTDDQSLILVNKARFFNVDTGLRGNTGAGMLNGTVRDSLFDGNNVSGSSAVEGTEATTMKFIDCEMKNHQDSDIDYSFAPAVPKILLRNCILASATEVDALQGEGSVLSEDHDGTLSDTRQLTRLSFTESTPVIRSDTGTVRSGGSNISLKIQPSSDFGLIKGWEHNQLVLFELPFYATTASKTYTVYLRPNVTGNFSADPLATELWLQAEYWGHASNNVRIIKKSTEVIDMDGSTAWQALTVTVAPAQVGVLYLSVHYTMALQAGKSNIFFCDPKPVVS